MRIFGSVQRSFWENSEIHELSDQSKLLAIYLLTGPHSNMLGCFRLPDGYIAEDLKWEFNHTKNAFDQLTEINFLTRDSQSSWVVIHQFLKWNPIQNPRQGIGVQKLFDIVPIQSAAFKPLVKSLLTYGKYLEKGFADRLILSQPSLETLSEESLADKEQNKDQEQDNKIQSLSSKLDEVAFSNKNEPSSFKSQAIEVLNFLNEKTGKRFRPVDTNLTIIISRLQTGATVTECRQIIAMKYREWKKNPDMLKYVRPETLFGAKKFESYIGELVLPKDKENINESI